MNLLLPEVDEDLLHPDEEDGPLLPEEEFLLPEDDRHPEEELLHLEEEDLVLEQEDSAQQLQRAIVRDLVVDTLVVQPSLHPLCPSVVQ